MNDIVADVIIVGAGVAGSLAATELARRGVKVAVLDTGPRLDRGECEDRFLNAVAKTPDSAYPILREAPHPLVTDANSYYRQSGPDMFKSTFVRAVGGTTWHWLGTSFRFRPADFQLRTLYGRGVDWPIRYDDLEPFYEAAEHALGVSGDGRDDLGAPRRSPFPMPPIAQTYLDKFFALKLAGTRYEVRPTPQARNSVERDGRPACCGSASCIPVCPVQAKYDGTVHVDAAEKAGAAVHEKCNAVSVELGETGRVRAIRFMRWDRSEGRAIGKVFILAANAIEIPRLLLASATASRPAGIANGSGQVGRNLMDHPAKMSSALAPEPVYPFRGPLSTSGIENLRDGAFRRERGAFRIEISNNGWGRSGAPQATVQALVAQGLRGAALDKALADLTSRQLRLQSLVEQDADPENRVTLDDKDRDFYGVPLPRIHYRISDYVKAGLAEAQAAHQDIFQRLGATAIAHAAEPEGSGHIIGTARMGADPKTSVVDAQLRSHDHSNLFVLGSAVFPTSAVANPTLTISALALRAVPAVMQALRE